MPLSFDGAGTITGLQVGGLPDGTVDQDTLAANSVNNAKLATGTPSAAALPSGTILQVVQSYKDDVFSTSTATTWEDITGLSVAITPSATTSDVLVLVDVRLGFAAGELAQLRLRRGSTTVGSSTIGTTGNGFSFYDSDSNSPSQTRVMATNTMTFLDSPSTTTSTTYKVQMWKDGSNTCLLYTSPSPRDVEESRMPSSA